MDIWAIIPVKSLYASKRRLAHLLNADERANLICQFLQHTLAILAQTTAVQQTLVISSDPRVLKLAWQYGALTIVEAAPQGLNVAVTQAARWAAAQGAEGALILPVDLPFLQASDVEQLVTAVAPAKNAFPCMAICADSAGEGTNALLLCPPGEFVFHYGPYSFQHHLAEAEKRNLSVRIVASPGVQFDLDTEKEWRIYTQRAFEGDNRQATSVNHTS